jgi:hypothetical protein
MQASVTGLSITPVRAFHRTFQSRDRAVRVCSGPRSHGQCERAAAPMHRATGYGEGAEVALPVMEAAALAAAEVGPYPIVTLQYSSTTSYQFSYHIQ